MLNYTYFYIIKTLLTSSIIIMVEVLNSDTKLGNHNRNNV